MDDKGSTLIIIFGFIPLAHQDDAQRALLTGFNLIKALKKIPMVTNPSIGRLEGIIGEAEMSN